MRRASVQLRSDAVSSPGIHQKRNRSTERVTHPDRPNQSHRRAASDPFDLADGAEEDLHYESNQKEEDVIPTLPRFPVSDSKDRNCWSQPPVETYKVRGKNYFADKKKAMSADYLLEARGVDLLLSDKPPDHIGRCKPVLGGALRSVSTLIVNFRFPWGVLVAYFTLPDRYACFLRHAHCDPQETSQPPFEGMTPQEITFVRFLMGDISYRTARFKLIPFVVEGPWVVRNMVKGTPVIIGNKLPVTYDYRPRDDSGSEYLEITLDVGSSSTAAKRIVSVCCRYMNALTVDVGFVVQGTSEDELPEQMLGAVRLHRLDPLKAPTLSNSFGIKK